MGLAQEEVNMAKYAINQEGAQSLWELAAKMEQIQQKLNDHGIAMRKAVECRQDELGIYGDQILELLDDNSRILVQAEEEVLELVGAARRYAQKIEELLAQGLQPGAAGGNGSAKAGGSMRSRNLPPQMIVPNPEAVIDARLLEKYLNAPYFDGPWERIKGEHSQKEDLMKTNPNISTGLPAWTENCQRCVPAYEMRRRGYDVEALPAKTVDHLARQPFDVWENVNVISCQDNGYGQIRDLMRQWGDGARCQIVVCWDGIQSGHTFVAEQVDEETRFYDPQIGDEEVSWYFSQVKEGRTKVARIDNVKPSKYITECCVGVNDAETIKGREEAVV